MSQFISQALIAFKKHAENISFLDAVKKIDMHEEYKKTNKKYEFYELVSNLFVKEEYSSLKEELKKHLYIRDHVHTLYTNNTFKDCKKLYGRLTLEIVDDISKNLVSFFNAGDGVKQKDSGSYNYLFYGIPGAGKTELILNIIKKINESIDIEYFSITNADIHSCNDV